MGTRSEEHRRGTRLNVARRNRISRTARVFATLERSCVAALNSKVRDWIAGGDITNRSFAPLDAQGVLEGTMIEALAQGYWLEDVFCRERLAALSDRNYRGRVALSGPDGGDPLRLALRGLVRGDGQEWRAVLPGESVSRVQKNAADLASGLTDALVEEARRRPQPLYGGARERTQGLAEEKSRILRAAQTRVARIARTEVTRAFVAGSLIRMRKDPDILGVEYCAILDGRTSSICAERHGLLMRLDDPRLPSHTPPLHPNCRSILLSATRAEYPEGVHTDARLDAVPTGIVPVRLVPMTPEDVLRYQRGIDDGGITLNVYNRAIKFEIITENRDNIRIYQESMGIEPASLINALLKDFPDHLGFESGRIIFDKILLDFAVQDRFEANVFSRSFSFEASEKLVVHNYMSLDSAAQGQGVAKIMMENAVQVYEKLGFKRIELLASLTKGAYVWAKFGFKPFEDSLEDLAGQIADRLDQIEEISEDSRKRTVKLLETFDYLALWRLSDLKELVRLDGEMLPLGKALLFDLGWDGGMDLDDRESLDRTWGYIRRGRKKTMAEKTVTRPVDAARKGSEALRKAPSPSEPVGVPEEEGTFARMARIFREFGEAKTSADSWRRLRKVNDVFEENFRKKGLINLDRDPSSDLGDDYDPICPMSREDQEIEMERIERICRTNDPEEIRKVFERWYGYRPTEYEDS